MNILVEDTFCELKVQYVDLEEDINKLSLFP